MSIAVPVPQTAAPRTFPTAWIVSLSALFILLYAGVLPGLLSQWWHDPDYGHGVFVALFSGFILWRERRRWSKAPIGPSNFGFVVMFAAVCLLFLGTLGAELFLSRVSMIVLLAGMILFLAGWAVLRAISFPVAYLLWMIPIPVILYHQMTFPLQLLASRLAASSLELFQVPVLRDGNILIMSSYSVEVVEACSGIRSLVSLMAIAVAFGYLVSPRFSMRATLCLLMVPIAILTNALRIMGAAILARHYGPQAAEGFLHEFSGWIIFVGAFLLMLACHTLLRRMPFFARENVHA
jgi:exosortase